MQPTFTPQQNSYFDKLLGSSKQVSQNADMSIAKSNADKIRNIGVTPSATSVQSTTQPTQTSESAKSFRYDAPLSHEEKMVGFRNEADAAKQKADEASSFGGFVHNAITSAGPEGLPFVGGSVSLSKIANKAIDNPFTRETEHNQALNETNIALQKQIRLNESKGLDTTRLKKLYNENADLIDQNNQTIKDAQANLPTTGQALGAGVHTLADALTAGTYGKATAGMTTGELAGSSGAPSLVQSAEQIAQKKAGLFTAQGLKNVVHASVRGALYAYPYDTALGLEGKRGSDREGWSALIPGQTTAIGGAIGGALAAGKGLVNSAQNAIAEHQANVAGRADRLAGQIAQGDVKDIPKVKSAISQIDTGGVKTYKDLGRALDDSVKETADGLDRALETNTDKYKIDELAQETKVGGKDVSHNYVQDALDKLKELYAKVNDPVSLEKVNQLEVESQNNGLTIKQINNLSRDFGNEFGTKAFSKSGDPLTSVNAQSLENIRSGIKDTARTLFDNPVYEEADKNMSNLLQTRSLVDDMSEKVNDLQQRIQPRGFGQKVGRAVGKLVDLITGGTVKGAVESFIPRGQGFKTLNALDLQSNLQDNLSKLSDILEKENMPENTVLQKIQDITNSLKNIPNKEGGFVLVGANENGTPFTPNQVRSQQMENKTVSDIVNNYDNSIERMSEQAGGWKEGMKHMFDTALHEKDADAVKALIKANAVPQEYLKRFADDITKVITKT